MSQSSIKSFFATQKRGNDSDDARRVKKTFKSNDISLIVTRAQPTKKCEGKFDLRQYTLGNQPDPNFYSTEDHRTRREKFRQVLGSSRRRSNLDVSHVGRKLTQLDQQYIELKRKYMDTLLIIEVGYKYKIFGEDAKVAASIFGWSVIPGWIHLDEGDPVDALYDRFASITFPTARLIHYVQKLVVAGQKVGVVNQMETAALKSISENKKGPFKRELTRLYTMGTYIDEITANVSFSGYILALYQKSNLHGTFSFSIVAVQPATGEIVYDEFEDSELLIELETRLLHIQPCEVIEIGKVTHSCTRLISNLAQKAKVRIETRDEPKNPQIIAESFDIQNVAGSVLVCIAVLVNYLEPFHLDAVFKLHNLRPFTTSTHMQLNGKTLTALEIFQNNTDYTKDGTLFDLLDHTRTPFGKRLFRKWVAQPLLDRELLSQRMKAVNELRCATKGSAIYRVYDCLTGIVDLERALLQIHFQRISRKQLYWFLNSLIRVASSITDMEVEAMNFRSNVLQDIFENLPSCRKFVDTIIGMLVEEKAKEGDRLDYFVSDSDLQSQTEVNLQKSTIKNLEGQMNEYLENEQRKLGIELKFTSFASDDFLIEVKHKDIKLVPENWRKMNGTKLASRYRTPETFNLIRALDLAHERLDLACDRSFREYLTLIASEFSRIRRTIIAISQLDCLFALTVMSKKPGYIEPDFVDEPCLQISKGRHPVVENLMLGSFIPNDVAMTANTSRTMVITGPNMGGKSCYVRQIALIVIMAQIGCYVPAEKARLSLVDQIFTRMGAHDNLMRGESTFMVELKECSDILNTATDRSLVLLDEIGRGTGTNDGMAIAYVVLRSMVEDVRSFTLFITHYPPLCELATLFPHCVSNHCMQYHEDDVTKIVTFLYQLKEGVTYRSYGLNVARLAGIDETILNVAAKKSKELEAALDLRRKANTWLLTFANMKCNPAGGVRDLLQLLEQN